MSDVEIKNLVRAYIALTLAHEAAERCAGASAAHPHLRAVLNHHRLAIGELEALLKGALAKTMWMSEVECASMLM